MSQPPTYSRQYNFTQFSSTNPSDQQPGVQVDAEFNAAKQTLDAILANLVKIQRDDGAIANASIGVNQLGIDAMILLATKWTVLGLWVTATVYPAGSVVTQGTSTYVSAVAHTAGVFATDLAANKWVCIFGAVTATVADGAVTTVKIVDGAVTAAKLAFTALLLSGTLTGQGGIAGGTASAGTYPVAGATSSGDALT